MKQFFKTIITFLIPIFLIVLFSVLLLRGLSIVVINNSKQYNFKEDIGILFLGDSHITNSVADSLIPNSLNLSKMSEPYYFTLQKLKFISKKHKIGKVVLGYSYHNIAPYYDEFINGNLSSVMPHKLFFCLEFKEQLQVLYWNKKKLLFILKKILITFYYQYYNFESKKTEYGFSDGFYNKFYNSTANFNSIKKRINFQYYSHSKDAQWSGLNILYLNKLIRFCKSNNIELILLNTPLHPEYLKNVPARFKFYLKKTARENNLKLINLENFNLPSMSYTKDGDHLSYSGAIIFSKKLLDFSVLNDIY